MRRYIRAIKEGNEEEVSRLLDADPALLEEEMNGDMPLEWAVDAGQMGMLKLLVHRGADINASGESGWTALHSATVVQGREEMVAFLPSKGARADSTDENGETPLWFAFSRGRLSVMKMLLQHMGAVEQERRGEIGWTPLMEACGEGKLGMVRMLVQQMGAQGLDDVDCLGRTALHWAALEGQYEVVAILLEKGAQADIGDDDDTTPLMWAASRGHLGVVQMLLEHMEGQGLDATNVHERTALKLAVQGGHEAVVTFLLSQGAHATNPDRNGSTPFMSAAAGGHVGMAQLFLELQGGQGLDDRYHTTGKTALHWAVMCGHVEAAAWLLKNGAGASIRDKDGRTPLMEVCESDRLGALEILLQEVGVQGLRERDVRGYTALHHAAMMDNEEAVQALLLAGADPTIKDNEGRTPRALAEEYYDECADVFEVSMR
jgi:ankyrin repeat protein